MNLARAFSESARRNLAKIALFWGDEEFSYGDLWARSLAVAERLTGEFGVKPGDRVGVWLKNCPEFVPAVFGILQAGGVVTPINNFLKPAEVLFILADAGIDVIFSDDSMVEDLRKLQVERAQLKVFRAEDISAVAGAAQSSAHLDTGPVSAEEPLSLALPPLRGARGSESGTEDIPVLAGETLDSGRSCPSLASDLAVIIYTSGTTGRPKGAMLTHANLLANLRSCQRVLEAVGDDRFVILLPMFHSFMLTVCVFLPLYVGGSVVLVKSVHPPKNVVQDIIRRQATILPAVPQLFRALSALPAGTELPLRLCISGGAPLPAEILKEFSARFSIPLLEGYGLSEASPVVSFNPVHGPWKAGSIGIPIYDVEVSVQNDAGDILNAGETGEICVRGDNVMRGYWNQPEETAKVLRNGWLLTGDIGHRDAEGYFYITDRKKDMLLVNGINVYPREIEEALYQFPGVREAAVIGVPSARKGEQPLAFVSATENVTLDENAMLKFLRERLADYKTPRRIIILPSLPRNATGKLLKTALRQSQLAEPVG